MRTPTVRVSERTTLTAEQVLEAARVHGFPALAPARLPT